MEKTLPLYLMISRTDTFIGKSIRMFSRYPYNHVSLTLDPSFHSWVSFARYAKDTPLYGGFIRETAERFLSPKTPVTVRIFRVKLPESRHRHLQALFSRAGYRDWKLVYNLFDALASGWGGEVLIPGAYTCLSFACAVLGTQCRSIRELDEQLSSCLIYEGELSALVTDSGDREDAYFQKLGLLRGSCDTARLIYTLSRRAFWPNFGDPVAHQLQ